MNVNCCRMLNRIQNWRTIFIVYEIERSSVQWIQIKNDRHPCCQWFCVYVCVWMIVNKIKKMNSMERQSKGKRRRMKKSTTNHSIQLNLCASICQNILFGFVFFFFIRYQSLNRCLSLFSVLSLSSAKSRWCALWFQCEFNVLLLWIVFSFSFFFLFLFQFFSSLFSWFAHRSVHMQHHTHRCINGFC